MPAPIDLTRAVSLTRDVERLIDDLFNYLPWDEDQVENGQKVREVLATAVKIIVASVPPGRYRTTAIWKIAEARMDCNAAITFRGKY